MRLNTNEITIIKNTILKYVHDAKIILFGSRVDDNKKGGDIDICVESKDNISLSTKLKILTNIELLGVHRKVDLILKTPNNSVQEIFKTINKEGIVL